MRRLPALAMMILLTSTDATLAQEVPLSQESDGNLTYFLNQMTMIAEWGSAKEHKAIYSVRVFVAPVEPGECSDTPDSCPQQYGYLAVSEFGEYPDQSLYRLPNSYGWEFEGWGDIPDRPGKDRFMVVYLKRTTIAKDTAKKWWDKQLFEIRVNPTSARMKEAGELQ